MQDSLEDYLRLTKTSRQNVSEKISKEIIVTAQLKKECDSRAMKIVEFSIEGKLKPEVFTRCLPFINQSHYQDIVEERAITKLCGYSICGKRIPEMPKKQYFISTKSNKVYDISERKNFCSNFCYKASLHVQNQIDNNPVWLRKLEGIPEYTFLHPSEGGLPGEFIDQGIIKTAQEPSFSSIGSFLDASLGDIMEKGSNPGKSKNNKTKGSKKSFRLKSTMQTITENEIEEEVQVLKNEGRSTKTRSHKLAKKEIHHKLSCIVSLPSIEENEEKVLERLQGSKDVDASIKDKVTSDIKENIQENKQEESMDRTGPSKLNIKDLESGQMSPIKEACIIKTELRQTGSKGPNAPETISVKPQEISIKTEPPEKLKAVEESNTNQIKKQTKKKNSPTKLKVIDFESIIRKALEEWFTIETCIFIHGEVKVKQVLTEKKLSDYFEEFNVAQLESVQQMKYMEICRRLQLQEMADDKFDSAVTGSKRLKPLPDMAKLKAETKEMTIKAKSFYEGTMYEQDDSNFPVRTNKSDKEENKDEGSPAVLPPVDVNSQKLLRRKIFLNSLNKAIQQLLQSLGVTYFSAVLSDVQALVKTFNLKADNITFKPVVWSYIALVLIDLISLKDDSIREILEEQRSQEYIKILFETLPNKKNFVNDVLSDIKDIEKFMKRYITKIDCNNV